MLRRLPLLAALPLLLALPAAAEETRTITVRGRGTVTARPDTLVMTFDASGKAEKAADAVAKLRTKADEMRKAINDTLKEKGQMNASIADNGLTFGGGAQSAQEMFLGGMGGNSEAAAETTVSTELKVTIPGVDKMPAEELALLVSSLLDKTAETGGGEAAAAGANGAVFLARAMGQDSGGGPVQFTFSNPDAVMDKAWEQAVARARARAEQIASKLGVTVGDAVRVRDASTGAGADKSLNPVAAALSMFGAGANARTTSSGDVELAAEVEVEFELKKK